MKKDCDKEQKTDEQINAENSENVEFAEDIVEAVRADFERYAEERRAFELQWRLNMNFVAGNQYCYISPKGEIEDNGRSYFWQQREVYNHLAPILESRISKLGRVRPKMSVLPATGDDADLYTAKMSSKILESAYHKLNVNGLITTATMWSETCGTVFYKISWDNERGTEIGADASGAVREGDIRIDVCPPFEIYPDNNYAHDLDALGSIIHAKAYPVSSIKDIWGAEVEPEDVQLSVLDNIAGGGGLGYNASITKITKTYKDGYALVIEKYERPCKDFPEGRLITVAGNTLLYYGALPYANGTDGARDFPFVCQRSLEGAGQFWGVSVIERAIPIQRAYNAVKNRKHEFMNRIAVGVLAVEDGSVDTDNLEEEGLSPGKILVYRQGSNPPSMLNPDNIPSSFNHEEDRLLSEFVTVTGVSELMRNSAVPNSVTSGVALQLLIEQDDTRLSITAELIRKAVKALGKHIIRLYKQFGGEMRMSRFVGDDGSIETMYWKASDAGSDDIVFITENELSTTPASRKSMVFDLLNAGLLADENGTINNHMRVKVLDLLGFGLWEEAQDISGMHVRRALKENKQLEESDIDCSEIDDHKLHITEHTRYMLSGEFEKIADNDIKQRFLRHLRMHKDMIRLTEGTE